MGGTEEERGGGVQQDKRWQGEGKGFGSKVEEEKRGGRGEHWERGKRVGWNDKSTQIKN